MKLKMKAVALAATLLATAGGANAAFVAGNVGNSTLGLLAFNTVTGAYYLRDTGFFMNSFLPSDGASITPSADAATATFDKTPEAGLTISSSDASFATWFSGQNATDVRWTVVAGDGQGTVATNRIRLISAVAEGSTFVAPSNGTIANSQSPLNGLQGSFGLSTTGNLAGTSTYAAMLANFIGQATTLTAVDAVANLYYWVRSTATGSTAVAATQLGYGNSAGLAQLRLEADGDFSYVLAPGNVAAVPLPAAAWLLGAGVLALGGLARRRSAAAEA